MAHSTWNSNVTVQYCIPLNYIKVDIYIGVSCYAQQFSSYVLAVSFILLVEETRFIFRDSRFNYLNLTKKISTIAYIWYGGKKRSRCLTSSWLLWRTPLEINYQAFKHCHWFNSFNTQEVIYQLLTKVLGFTLSKYRNF